MELFKILGKIAIDVAEALEKLRQAQQEGEKTESKLGKAFSAMGKGAVAAGKLIGKGLLVGAGAITALGAAAINAYGDYEQLVGGVETLFGTRGAKSVEEYAKMVGKSVKDVEAEFGMLQQAQSDVMNNAAKAYETAGLSMNEYMETANGLAAALNQSSASQLESAALADQAIIDMADNAAKMGTSMESIQTAYAGFAKQNYTMLDNLKLGYGGTKEEMQRLLDDASKISGIQYDLSSFADVTEAIHVMQVEMGIAGTTAKEASGTIQGSWGMLKGAWSNLMVGLSDPEADISSLINNVFSSVETFAGNLIPRITQVISGIASAFKTLVPMLVAEIPELLNQVLPALVEGAVALVNGLVEAMPSIISSILAALPTLIQGVIQLVQGLLQALPQIFQQIVEALPGVIQMICDALPTLIPMLIDAVVNMIVTLCQNFGAIIQPLIDSLPDIIISLVQALVNNLPALIEGIIQLILGIVAAIPQIIQALVDALPTIISMLVESTLNNLPAIIMGLIQVVLGIVKSLPQIFASLIKAVPAALSGIWDGIGNVFGNIGGWFKEKFSAAKEAAANAWSNAKEKFGKVWENVKGAFANVGNWFKDKFAEGQEKSKLAWAKSKEIFGKVWDNIKGAFSKVGSWFKDIFSQAWENVKNVFSGVGSFFTGIWDKIKNAFSAIGTKIGDAISGAVKKGINGIIGMAENVVNGFLKLINGAINLINKIPGVNIPKIQLLQFPRLAKGGVLEKGQIGMLEGDGAEAVVPLEKNKEWIGKVVDEFQEKAKSSSLDFSGMTSSAEGLGTNLKGSLSKAVDTAKKGVNKARNIGEFLVQGIETGINKTSKKMYDKVKGFGSGVLNTLTNFFGIASPSAVMRDQVGKNLAEGVAVGILGNASAAATASEKLGATVVETAEKKLEEFKKYNDMSLADEVAYWDKIRQCCAEGTDARKAADKSYLEAKKSFDEQLLAAEEELQSALDAIHQKIEDRTQELMGSFSMFEQFQADEAVSGKDLLKNIQDQNIALQNWEFELKKLGNVIGGTHFFDYLKGLGVEGLNQVREVASMTREELFELANAYGMQYVMSKNIASSELEDENLKETQEAYQEFAATCESLGVSISTSQNTIFADMATNIGNKMTDATESVSSALQNMAKSFNDFTAHMNMPHINVSGSFSLDPPSAPSYDVEWYKKAMDTPMLMNEPTIFGYNSASGKFMGGGEAGSEVVSGTKTLMNMIQNAVSEQNNNLVYYMQKIIDVLSSYFPQFIDAFNVSLNVDGYELASAMAVPMDQALGKLSSRKDRGR